MAGRVGGVTMVVLSGFLLALVAGCSSSKEPRQASSSRSPARAERVVPPKFDAKMVEGMLIGDGTDVAGAPSGWENPQKVLDAQRAAVAAKTHAVIAPSEHPVQKAMEKAALILNARLDELVARDDQPELQNLFHKPDEIRSSYDYGDGVRRLAWECYKHAWETPEPVATQPRGQGLFGGGDAGAGPGLFAESQPARRPATGPTTKSAGSPAAHPATRPAAL